MTQKRKISYEQDLALAAGRDIARSNQRRRTAQRQAEDKRIAEWEQAEREHIEKGLHGWKNWEYSADYTTETRICRECGATETRKVRL